MPGSKIFKPARCFRAMFRIISFYAVQPHFYQSFNQAVCKCGFQQSRMRDHCQTANLFYNIDGKEYGGVASITCKAGRYGGNFRIAPDADIAEPALYTFIFQGNRRRDLLRYVSRVVTGTLREDRDIVYLKSTSIDVLGTAHIQIDGDYLGTTPARITVEKDALQIIY